ncbi:cell division protein ZapA [Parasediminibacterium paludis]|uniref:Cell division protein ZapA n=1 Tax=Parasediminibacterium paludis TaxID=908966 RepID=A0ABV8PV34_9BACT
MSELIPINIAIADRTYRLKLRPEDEEVVRKTVKMINEKIVEFKTNFAGKDIQDYISMVLIWLATEQTQSAIQLIQLKDATEKITMLQNNIDKALAASSENV